MKRLAAILVMLASVAYGAASCGQEKLHCPKGTHPAGQLCHVNKHTS